MVGLNNNYLIYEVDEKFLKKDGILDDFNKVDYGIEGFNIKDLILETLKKGGVVYGVKEKKTLKAVFIFDLMLVQTRKKKKKEKHLVFSNVYFTEDLSRALPGFSVVIEENLQEKIANKEISKANWNGKEIVNKSYIVLNESVSCLLACLILSLCLGMAFGHLIPSLCIGLAVGLIFGGMIRSLD